MPNPTMPHETIGLATSRAPSLYLITWGILAAFALGYLALLAVRPDIAQNLFSGPFESAPESNRGQRAMTRAMAEINGLKQSLARLEGEMGELRVLTASEQKRSAALETRLATAEDGQKATAARLAAIPAPATAAAATAAEGAGEPRATKAQREARSPETPAEIAAAVTAQAATTLSAPAAKPVEARPKGPPLGLWVGTGPSLDAVRLSWQLLQEGNKGTLKALEARFVESSGDPPAYQLIAGPVATREEANKACERLRAKQSRCTVIPFTGQPL